MGDPVAPLVPLHVELMPTDVTATISFVPWWKMGPPVVVVRRLPVK